MQIPFRSRLADRVWRWRKLTYAVSTGLVLVGIIITFISISTPSTIVEPATEPAFFDGQRAFLTAQQFAQLYPERPVGSTEAQGATAWCEDRLTSLKIPFEIDTFSAPFGEKSMEISNVSVVLPGSTAETILITSPREAEPDSGLSPLARATGTAMILDLVQVFAARPHDKTLIFLSTEAAGYGGLGVSHFLDTYARAADIAAVLSFQGLGYELRESLKGGTTGPGVATPGWLVELTSRVLADSEVRLELPNLQEQIADQALRIYQGEQVAGLRARRAALMLYDVGEGNVRPAGLATQGTALERIILSLDGGGRTPNDPGTAIVLSSGRYVTKRALCILGILVMLPALAMALTWLAVTHLSPSAWLRHVKNVLSFMLPLGISPLAIWAAARFGWLPRYQFQANPMDAAAMRPNWLAAAVLMAFSLVLFVLSRHFLGYLRPREPRTMTEMAKLSSSFVLLVVGLILLNVSSPFSMINALTVAWLWPLATCFREPRNPLAPWWPHFRSNIVVLLFGLLAPLLLYVYLALNTGAGFFTGWWFLLMQLVSGAYGVAGPAAAVLLVSSFMILLGVKRLTLLPMETLEDKDDLALVELPPPRVRKVKRAAESPENG